MTSSQASHGISVCLNDEGKKQFSGISFYKDHAAAAKSLQSCPTLCDPMDCSLPGSSVHGIFQARVLEWGDIAFSIRYPAAKSLQSCPTLCDPMDCSLPGSSIHGIFQATVLEWDAIAFSLEMKREP